MNSPRVLETTKVVLDQAQFVKINHARLAERCRTWAADPFITPPWDTSVHWDSTGSQLANYILVLDCLNFCFWPDPGQPRWTIEYAGRQMGGYQALAASLRRAVEEGVPLLEADWLAQVTPDQVRAIFRGQNEIPLLESRVKNMREVGNVLLSKYDGQFANAINACHGSAVALVNVLAEEFSSFHDIPLWKGQPVRILKRAQITVTDLHGSFHGEGLGHFQDIGALTAYADYKIPQVLRALGILEYSEPLARKVDARQLIPAGSEEEIEIRVSMVWAIEFIARELARLGQPRQAYELDWFLWNLGQSPLPDERPYHLTRTIFY